MTDSPCSLETPPTRRGVSSSGSLFQVSNGSLPRRAGVDPDATSETMCSGSAGLLPLTKGFIQMKVLEKAN